MVTVSSNIDITASLPAQDTEEQCQTQRQSVQFKSREHSGENEGAELENVHFLSDPQRSDENGARPFSTGLESIISPPPSFTTEPPSALASTPGSSFNHHADSGLRFLPTALQENWRSRIFDAPPAYTEE